jgi:hypothetical protein
MNHPPGFARAAAGGENRFYCNLAHHHLQLQFPLLFRITDRQAVERSSTRIAVAEIRDMFCMLKYS